MKKPQRRNPRPVRPAKGERELIRRIAALLPGGGRPIGFGDDMARLEAGAGGLLWTTDMLMDGVDFDSRAHAWAQIGRKAMAVNLSDCAATATRPVAALCAVALNDGLSMDDAVALFRGVLECGTEFDCPVSGGDTNSWAQPTVVCIAVAARPEPDCAPVTREGARPGDLVWLTGAVGGSLLGRHLRPEPRIREALEINRRLAPRAMIDISDGLAVDLWHICEASGCGAWLDESLLEAAIHADARRLAEKSGSPPLEHALYDGEDFELITALPADAPGETCAQLGLIRVGQFTAERELVLRRAAGTCEPVEIRGWEHFRA